jgi:uncharacterized membrane protein YozB (DUF420 family)
MDLLHILPHINAVLNATSGVFLLAGFYFIRNKDIAKHRACMLIAASLSAVFLVGYITHHSLRTYYLGVGPTRFTGEGLIRPIYFSVLTSHTILAALVAPFVLMTLWRGLMGQYETHRKIARLVFPVWVYISLTGVMVYLLLYQLYPAR